MPFRKLDLKKSATLGLVFLEMSKGVKRKSHQKDIVLLSLNFSNKIIYLKPSRFKKENSAYLQLWHVTGVHPCVQNLYTRKGWEET